MGTLLEFFPFGSGAVLVPWEVLLVLSLLRVAVTKAGSARLCSAGVFDPAAGQLWDVHGSAAEGTVMQIRDVPGAGQRREGRVLLTAARYRC